MVLSSWQSHCDSSPSSFDGCRTAPNGRRTKTKPDDLGCESACTGCQNLHPPSPFIIITQPESWYSFYRPTEGSRLSWPSWLVIYRNGSTVHRWSPILVLTGSDVGQLHWSRPTRYHYAKPPTLVELQKIRTPSYLVMALTAVVNWLFESHQSSAALVLFASDIFVVILTVQCVLPAGLARCKPHNWATYYKILSRFSSMTAFRHSYDQLWWWWNVTGFLQFTPVQVSSVSHFSCITTGFCHRMLTFLCLRSCWATWLRTCPLQGSIVRYLQFTHDFSLKTSNNLS